MPEIENKEKVTDMEEDVGIPEGFESLNTESKPLQHPVT
jgi:hypothetical protein